MALKQANTQIPANVSETGFALGDACHIGGHRAVYDVGSLYALKDWQLLNPCVSDNRMLPETMAAGQQWYVVKEKAYYRLVDYSKRKTSSGWQVVSGNGGASGAPSAEQIKLLDEKINGNVPIENEETDADGLFLTDKNLNVVAKYDKEGFDVARLSSHAKSLLKKDYANVIVATTRKKVELKDLESEENTVTFYKDLEWDTWLCSGKNYLTPTFYSLSSKVVQGVTISTDTYNRLVLNGTATGTDMASYGDWHIPEEKRGKEITVAAIGCKQLFIRIENTNDGTARSLNRKVNGDSLTSLNIALEEGENRIIIKVANAVESGITYSNKHIWVGIYLADEAQLIKAETGDTVTGHMFGGLYYPITMTYYADTKTYIDENGVGGWITPEQYGAVGDGIADDTRALQDCIDMAMKENVPVKGFGTYKLTDTISVDGNYTNIFINKLSYEGSSCAFRLYGHNHEIEIREIISSNIGIEGTQSRFDNLFQQNHITIGRIVSQSHCIEIYTMGATPGDSTTYRVAFGNRWDVYSLTSQTGHCLYVHDTWEDSAYFVNYMKAAKNWSVYSGGTMRLYNTELEDTAAGFLVQGDLVVMNCRVAELIKKQGSMSDFPYAGYVAKINGGGRLFFADPQVNMIGNQIELSPHKYDNAFYATSFFYSYKIGTGLCMMIDDAKADHRYCGFAEYWRYGNRLSLKPHAKFSRTFTEDADFNALKTTPYYLLNIEGTCTIKLGDSYNPVGMSEFIVNQTGDNKATLIDVWDRKAFDGSQYEAGKYKVEAVVTYNLAGYNICYEDNFEWVVTKIG